MDRERISGPSSRLRAALGFRCMSSLLQSLQARVGHRDIGPYVRTGSLRSFIVQETFIPQSYNWGVEARYQSTHQYIEWRENKRTAVLHRCEALTWAGQRNCCSPNWKRSRKRNWRWSTPDSRQVAHAIVQRHERARVDNAPVWGSNPFAFPRSLSGLQKWGVLVKLNASARNCK